MYNNNNNNNDAFNIFPFFSLRVQIKVWRNWFGLLSAGVLTQFTLSMFTQGAFSFIFKPSSGHPDLPFLPGLVRYQTNALPLSPGLTPPGNEVSYLYHYGGKVKRNKFLKTATYMLHMKINLYPHVNSDPVM